ncbi:MAG: shikimate dehydrogenase [Bacteroidetes bacterium]|jgi:shikimate dehydrogenase|nr:shikimate dehydrogenase [Bacteroidota bacterium]MBK8672322.1 shikimate dehydrogenase [Bacteroidota bacterium]MBL0080325.1 shikimate dehydrogenase [Bacteroidota bacterium]MBL0285969.1 shikimate dehydrogenase [Bacteroidota bacterium]
MLKKYGLIGYPLSHSFSKGYFTEKFKKEGIKNAAYETYPLEKISDFTTLLQNNPELVGLNVTIPYKEAIIPYLDELSEEAKKIGAVNTIKIINGKKIGYNSDVVGFEKSLIQHLKPTHNKALVLGTGGAAKAVWFVLEKLNIPYLKVSRTASENIIAYDTISIDLVKEYPLIINTTPLGMSPKLETKPDIPYQALTKNHFLYDLVYNPQTTLFLEMGQKMGATIQNGLPMLHGQAERSWELWNT